MRSIVNLCFKVFCTVICLFIFCEWLIHYLVLVQCDWPQLDVNNKESDIKNFRNDPVRALVLTDIHLLGANGYWIDKVIREWQMQRTFQIAMHLHQPDFVFVLGDVTNEGSYCSDSEFDNYIKRFHELFAIPANTKMFVVVGNHDIGFHNSITSHLNQRFMNAFNTSSAQLITIRNNHFVLVNSMALEGDSCFLCKNAESKLARIEKILNCSKEQGNCTDKLEMYSRPILMTHFPLYRVSENECNEPDGAPFSEKNEKFKERWDCLSVVATHQLLKQIQPRLVMNGHTHHGCTRILPFGKGIEITLPSFNWRNKNNPSYGLFVVTPNNYAFAKCLMPKQSTTIINYVLGIGCLLLWIAIKFGKFKRLIKGRVTKYKNIV